MPSGTSKLKKRDEADQAHAGGQDREENPAQDRRPDDQKGGEGQDDLEEQEFPEIGQPLLESAPQADAGPPRLTRRGGGGLRLRVGFEALAAAEREVADRVGDDRDQQGPGKPLGGHGGLAGVERDAGCQQGQDDEGISGGLVIYDLAALVASQGCQVPGGVHRVTAAAGGIGEPGRGQQGAEYDAPQWSARQIQKQPEECGQDRAA